MRKLHFFALIAGLILMFGGPAVGLFVTILRMRRAIAVAQACDSDTAARLAVELSPALLAIQVGLALGALGLVVLLAALAAHFATRKARRRGTPLLPPASDKAAP